MCVLSFEEYASKYVYIYLCLYLYIYKAVYHYKKNQYFLQAMGIFHSTLPREYTY